jgi:hypothetical protein
MALPTYLSLVNKVLVNLRESTVTTINVSYTQLVAAFINQAKEKVEDAWAWRCLTIPATWNTVTSQASYILDGTGSPTVTVARTLTDRAYLARTTDWAAQVFATSAPVVATLDEAPYEDLISEIRETSPIVNQIPYKFAYSVPAGVPTLLLARPADGVYAMEARFVNPQGELVNDTDTMIVPYRPVVSLATAMAMQERGEELGSTSDLYMGAFADELSRAISNDREDGTAMFTNS